jgi:hypothetical protein
MRRNRRPVGYWAAAMFLGIGITLTGCEATTPQAPEARFLLRACRWSGNPDGEMFRIALRDSAEIAAAERELRERRGRIISGRLARGDGGFNAPWHWHLLPDSTWVVDGAIEVCDGCPSGVEERLDAWLAFGGFCPWTTEFIAREQ